MATEDQQRTSTPPSQRHGNPILLITTPVHVVTAASWLYPFKGIYYFLAHPFLYPLLRARLIPAFVLSLIVLATLFIWTYLPQVAFLSLFHGPALAWVQAAFLVLGEGAAIVALLFEAFFIDETLVDVFDAVLVNEGLENFVAPARALNQGNEENSLQKLGKPTRPALYSPFSFRQIAEFILLLPLNLIPVAGTPMFLVLTGYRAGPFHHWRYFKLRAFSKKDRKAFITRRQLRYTWFGTSALLLQLVPVLSMFFLVTTAAGSALWAVKLEEARRVHHGARLDDPCANDTSPPPYVDDPV